IAVRKRVGLRDVEQQSTRSRTAHQGLQTGGGLASRSGSRRGGRGDRCFAQIALERAPEGGACFIHGALANSLERAQEFVSLARSRKIALLAGTPLCVTWR